MRLEMDRLKAATAGVLRAAGVAENDASGVAEILVWTDAVGRSTHGIRRVPILVRRVAAGVLATPCRPRIESTTGAMTVIDGANGIGPIVAQFGMENAIEKARELGVGVTLARHSNWFGAGAYYVAQAAAEGMVGIAASNSYPKVAAHGGRRPVLGTNPIALGAPRAHGESLLLDMATSAMAGGTLSRHVATSQPLPSGAGVDEHGQPTSDPARATEGALLPLGGAKGFGLALLVEVLSGVLSGSGFGHGVASMYKNFEEPGNNGHFFLALDIAKLMPPEVFVDRLETLLRATAESPRDSPDAQSDVRIPGELRWRTLAESRALGVWVDPATIDELSTLADSLGVGFP